MKTPSHKSFILSHSPVKHPIANAAVSALLLGIVAVNVVVLFDASEALQACVF
jgi:hypothetical protein